MSYGKVDIDRFHELGLFGKKVFCDGVEIEESTEFDDIAGYVDYFVKDNDGAWRIDWVSGTLVTERRYGCITIGEAPPSVALAPPGKSRKIRT